MPQKLRKFLLPFALGAAGWAMQLTGTHSPLLGVVLYFLAGASFLLAACAVLLDRWPWMVAWLPVPDSWRKDSLSLPVDLCGTYIRGQHFKIATMAEMNQIHGRHFEDCYIFGPAVLYLSGTLGVVTGCTFTSPPEAFLIETVPSQNMIDGTIRCVDCIFRRCTFVGVGFVGSAQSLAVFRNEIAQQVAAQAARETSSSTSQT